MNYDVLFFIHVNRHDFGHYNLMRVFGNAYQMQQMFFFQSRTVGIVIHMPNVITRRN